VKLPRPLAAAADGVARRIAGGRGRLEARRAIAAARSGAAPVHASPSALRPALQQLASDCHSVLDVGTGLMHSLADSPCPVRVGVDAHRPYLEQRLVQDAVAVNADALEIGKLFLPASFDSVTMIDVLEHFAEDDAVRLLDQARTIARKRVVLFTPRGQFPQEHDAWDMGGESFQRHRSTWEPETLAALGLRVLVLDKYHGPWNSSFVEAFGPDGAPVDALLAWHDQPRPSADQHAGRPPARHADAPHRAVE
jgi:hypothetical protein